MSEKKENFVFDENLIPYTEAGSMVLRLEHMLAGKSPDEMLEKSSKLFKFFIDFYEDLFQNYLKEIKLLPSEKNDSEYQEYLKLRELFYTPFKNLNNSDKEKLHSAYCKTLKAYAEKVAPQSAYKQKIDFDFENFDFDEMRASQSITRTIQETLKKFYIRPKRELYYERLDEITKQLKDFIEINENKICFAVNREIFFKHYDEIKEIFKNPKFAGKKLELVLDDDGERIEENDFERRMPYTYSADEMKKLGAFMSEVGAEVYFSEFYLENIIPYRRGELWSFKDVMKANFERHDFVEHFKPLEFSPFEQIILISEHMSEMAYTGHASNDEKTRTLLTAKQTTDSIERQKLLDEGKGFVCTSFASYAKAMLDDFQNPLIKSKLINLAVYSQTTKRKILNAVHAQLLIYIEDEKYGIEKGYYIWDPTWQESYGLSVCLYPVADAQEYIGMKSHIDENLNLPKKVVFLHPPRSEKGDNLNNYSFIGKYGCSFDTIPVYAFEQCLREVFEKLKKSEATKKFFRDADEIIYEETEILVEDRINETFRSLELFNPVRAKNDFYVALKTYLIERGEFKWDEFEDWFESSRGSSYDVIDHKLFD